MRVPLQPISRGLGRSRELLTDARQERGGSAYTLRNLSTLASVTGLTPSFWARGAWAQCRCLYSCQTVAQLIAAFHPTELPFIMGSGGPLAQLDRAAAFEADGREFESLGPPFFVQCAVGGGGIRLQSRTRSLVT